jgi:hypothetical protein
MSTTYSIDNDVAEKYSHLTIPSGLSVPAYRDNAYNIINANLRKLYVVPIDSTNAVDLGYLKIIESELAAGKIIQAVATVHEAEGIHEYGETLIKSAEEFLGKLIDENIILSGATRDTDDSSDVVNAPIIHGSSADDYAAFDRPMSGIENDAIEGKVDSEEYNELEDTKTI